MIEDIEKIIKIFENAKISKLDLELDNMKIKLEKNDEPQVIVTNASSIVNSQPVVESKPVENNNYTHVTSPVVGTFYLQKAEGHPALITVGQKVHKGDVLCIIEAMKVMNEITSPCDGVIKEILAENEQLVEFGQDIVLIGDNND